MGVRLKGFLNASGDKDGSGECVMNSAVSLLENLMRPIGCHSLQETSSSRVDRHAYSVDQVCSGSGSDP